MASAQPAISLLRVSITALTSLCSSGIATPSRGVYSFPVPRRTCFSVRNTPSIGIQTTRSLGDDVVSRMPTTVYSWG